MALLRWSADRRVPRRGTLGASQAPGVPNGCLALRHMMLAVDYLASICRKWVGVLGNGALHFGARIVVRTSWLLN
jgi:hypothetical protein